MSRSEKKELLVMLLCCILNTIIAFAITGLCGVTNTVILKSYSSIYYMGSYYIYGINVYRGFIV